MLSYRLLTSHKGILLTGDYLALRKLHDVVHTVNEGSVLVKDKEGALLRLAYEIRKAYERQRRIITPPKHYEEVGVRYGFEVLWPEIIVTSRMLRESMAFMATDKSTQSIVFNLEALIEEAIEEDFGAKANEIKDEWLRINTTHSWPEEHLSGRCAIFESWTKSERRKFMRSLLLSFNPMYQLLYSTWESAGEDLSDFISPDEFASWDDEEPEINAFAVSSERTARSFQRQGL